jgi:beta-lactamase superfamily II metal-dependent hydrolase
MTDGGVVDHLQLSRSKIYEMAQRGKITCSNKANQWKFRRQELDGGLQAQSPHAGCWKDHA